MEQKKIVPENKVLNALNLSLKHFDLELLANLLEIFEFKQTEENLAFLERLLGSNFLRSENKKESKNLAIKSIANTLVSEGWDLQAPIFKENFNLRGQQSAISGSKEQEPKEFCIIDLLLGSGHLATVIEQLEHNQSKKDIIDFLIRWDESKAANGYSYSYSTPSKLCSMAVSADVATLDKLLSLGLEPNYRKATLSLQNEVLPAFCYAKNNEQLSVFVKYGADFSLLKETGKTFIDIFKRIEDNKERSAMFKTYEESLKLQAKNKNQVPDFSGEIASIEKFLANKKVGLLEIKRLIKSIGSNLKDFTNSKGESFGYLICKYERQDLLPSLAKEGIDILNLKGSDGTAAIAHLLKSSISSLKPAKSQAYASFFATLPLGFGDSKRSLTNIIENSPPIKVNWAHQRLLLKWFKDSVSSNPNIKDELLVLAIKKDLLPLVDCTEFIKENGGIGVENSQILKELTTNLFKSSLSESYNFYSENLDKLFNWLKESDYDNEKIRNLFSKENAVETLVLFMSKSIDVFETESRYVLSTKKLENVLVKTLELKEIIDEKVKFSNVPTSVSVEELFNNFVKIFSNKKSLSFFSSLIQESKKDIERNTPQARVFKMLEPYLGTAMLALASVNSSAPINDRTNASSNFSEDVYDKKILLIRLAEIVDKTGIDGYAPEILAKMQMAPWVKTLERQDVAATLEKAIFDAQIKSNELNSVELINNKVAMRL